MNAPSTAFEIDMYASYGWARADAFVGSTHGGMPTSVSLTDDSHVAFVLNGGCGMLSEQ